MARLKSKKGRRSPSHETMKVRGFFHIQLVNAKTGKIDGETSGYNVVTANGFEKFIVGSIGDLTAVTTNLTINALALATKSDAISSSDNTIAGETGGRKTLADTTNTASNRKLFSSPGTLQCVASWSGTDLSAGPRTIGSIAAFNSSSGGSMACAATYTTSQWTSDQNVNATYELRFS